jgi:DNA polymerase I-like protein with 3'-5' exonuclease and polymerase domains
VISGGASGRTSLNDLTEKYCGVTLDKSLQRSFVYGKELTPAQINYAYQDIIYLPKIMEEQVKEIERLDLWGTIEVEMKCVPAVAWMELSGANVDIPTLKAIETKVRAQKEASEKMLISELTYTTEGKTQQKTLFGDLVQTVPKLNSPKSLLEALHKKGYTKLEGTDKKELSKYQGDSLITELKLYRGNDKLIVGFINRMMGYNKDTGKYGESEFINPVTGRVHASFNQCGARSGRFSCSEPNMQQQPARVEEWRHIYKALPGNMIVSADYSQIELRIVGQLSGEPAYIQAYTEGYDLHKRTASQMFNVPLEEVTKNQR